MMTLNRFQRRSSRRRHPARLRRTVGLVLAAVVAASLPALQPTIVNGQTAGSQQAAAAPQGCAAPEYRQFDFWVGEWEVFAPNGQPAGRNTIESVLGGCAIHESWTSASGSTGYSYTFWDARGSKWHQTWIDSNGAPLYLDGAFEDGKMVLGDGTNRVTWSSLGEGRVRQHWEVTQDGGATWTTAFDGEYRPVSAR